MEPVTTTTPFSLPTETVELPSKGLVYPADNPLSSGQVEIKYMTAREEDILTNQSYIDKGIVFDKLLKSLVVSKINVDDLTLGDKDALMIAARILGYGSNYTFTYGKESYTVDLSTLENKPIDERIFTQGTNEFEYNLPHTGNKITFKLLTGHDEKLIDAEIKGLKKINPEDSHEFSTRLKFLITSVNDSREVSQIRNFVDNFLIARDSRELRKHIELFQPGVDLRYFPPGSQEPIRIDFQLSFFWPDL
jgi:hypothetical protein